MLGNSCIYSVLHRGPVTEEKGCPVQAKMLPRTSLQTSGNLLPVHHSTQKFILKISTSVDHKNLAGEGSDMLMRKHELYTLVVQTASPYCSEKINICITRTIISIGLNIMMKCFRCLCWKSTKYKCNTLSDDTVNSLHIRNEINLSCIYMWVTTEVLTTP